MKIRSTPALFVPVLLASAVFVAWLLHSAPEHHPSLTATAASVATHTAHVEGATRSPADPEAVSTTPQADEAEQVDAEPIVDVAAEDARAAARYQERIEANIAHLEAAAEAALADGRPERAELMEKRIDGLLRRMDEAAAAGELGG